nr:unnamed protein product [Callosobruchus chinensis]
MILFLSFQEESSLIQTPFPGVREAIRERLRQKSIPEETIPIILASLSDNTLKQYSYCYKKWWNFCSIGIITRLVLTLMPYSGF